MSEYVRVVLYAFNACLRDALGESHVRKLLVVGRAEQRPELAGFLTPPRAVVSVVNGGIADVALRVDHNDTIPRVERGPVLIEVIRHWALHAFRIAVEGNFTEDNVHSLQQRAFILVDMPFGEAQHRDSRPGIGVLGEGCLLVEKRLAFS